VSDDLTDAAYKDPGLEPEMRVEDLLSRMTLEEKVAQMTSYSARMAGRAPGVEAAREVLVNGIGQLSRPIGSGFDAPAEGAKAVNSYQRLLVEGTRLGIPAIAHEEALSGLQIKGATIFPQAIGQGSTWDPPLIERMTTVIRRQMRAVGIRHALSPNVDVVRDPRWGRIEECFGEDPYLVASIGTAFVKGLQGDDPASGCIATVKHFLGYSASEGGRNQEPTHIGPRTLRETFGLPFETIIRHAGVRAVMNSYSQIDGVPVQKSREILTELLRDEYAFEGLLVADYGSIDQLHNRHHTAADRKEAAVQAVYAGTDTELPTRTCYGPPLLEAVCEGQVSEADIDRFVRRILTWKFRLGIFDDPYAEASSDFDSSEDRSLARDVAARSIVLLQNNSIDGEGPVLPLSPGLGSIAVIGPNADRPEALLGDYAYPIQIESLERLIAASNVQKGAGVNSEAERLGSFARQLEQSGGTHVVTVLEGIRSRVEAGTEVRYVEGCCVEGEDTTGIAAAVAAAAASSVAVVVVGDQSGQLSMGTVGEHVDSATLALPGVQRQLVEAVAATRTPLVVVLTNGRPFVLDWMVNEVPAIFEAWFPGEEGGHAIADVLFGGVNPGGKTCVSFPRHAGIQPLFYNHKPIYDTYYDTTIEPVFPFGHGLSYTTFEYDELQVSQSEVPVDGELTIRCRVSNRGERVGDEVVQLYVHDLVASTGRPVQELKGFRRITLKPGGSARVSFELAADQLAFYDPDQGWIVEPGAVELMVGSSSADIRLRRQITLTGKVRVAGPDRILVTPTAIDRIR
jgi:beta-glucosidase